MTEYESQHAAWQKDHDQVMAEMDTYHKIGPTWTVVTLRTIGLACQPGVTVMTGAWQPGVVTTNGYTWARVNFILRTRVMLRCLY